MKFLFIVLAMMSSPLVVAADMQRLPEAMISARVLGGGTVLLIRMRYSLVINYDVQMAITRELGEQGRRGLFRSMIVGKAALYLKTTYCSENSKVVCDLVRKYEVLTSSLAHF